MKVTMQMGSKATVYVPAASKEKVFENGAPAQSATGVEFVEMRDGYAVFQVSSGEYSFRVR